MMISLRKQGFLSQFRTHPSLVSVPVPGPDPPSYAARPYMLVQTAAIVQATQLALQEVNELWDALL